RVGEGHQFSMDQVPVAGRATEAWRTDLLLPASVRQWIGGALGQDQTLRHFEGREPSVEMVEPAPDHGRFDAASLGAEALIVPVAPFQGAVNEEPKDGLGSVFRVCVQLRGVSNVHAFTPSGRVPLRSWGMKRNSLFSTARTSAWRMVSMVMGGTSSSRQPFSLSTAKSIKADSEA